MARVLWNKERRSGWTGRTAYRVCRVRRLALTTGERRWVEIVSEIETDRANRRLVAHPHADSVRHTTEIAVRHGTLLHACLHVALLPAVDEYTCYRTRFRPRCEWSARKQISFPAADFSQMHNKWNSARTAG